MVAEIVTYPCMHCVAHSMTELLVATLGCPSTVGISRRTFLVLLQSEFVKCTDLWVEHRLSSRKADMSDPLSISASVIAVAGLAYSSCKVLSDTIKSFRNAPKTLADIRTELSAIRNLLDSLINTLGGVENIALSNNQRTCFINLESAIKHCETTCKDFTGRLSRITSHSGTDHVNWFDRTRLHFNENDVSLLRAALERDKQTLDFALGVATL